MSKILEKVGAAFHGGPTIDKELLKIVWQNWQKYMIDHPVTLRSDGNYDTNQASDQTALECKDKSLAQQEFAEESDINYMFKKYVVTGEMPQLVLPPMQGDFTNVPTYQEAMNKIVEAQHSFAALDAQVRARFDNDPAKWVDFASDPKNSEEMRKMGHWNDEATARFDAAEKLKADIQAKDKADAEAHRASQKGGKKDT